MEQIIYSENFYVNQFKDKGVDYAKGFIQAFMNKKPRKLVEYLEEQDHFGKVNPEFQAVIIGEPRGSLFGKAQAAVLIVHSNFIAYTTTSDYNTPMGINYGYATFDNDLSVSEENNQLEMHIPYETFYFGVGSNSSTKDFTVIEELIEKNHHSIDLFYEVHQERSEKQPKTMNPIASPLPTGRIDKELSEDDEEIYPGEEVDDNTKENEKEWGHILMEENNQGELQEMKHLPVERPDQYPAEQAHSNQTEEPQTRRERKTYEPTMDKRFDVEGPILSNDSIPNGFVYKEPVVYVKSVRPGFFKTATARGAYTKAYHACLDEMREDIEEGKFDAVFNLNYSAQSIENYYDVMVTGDAVVYE